VKRTYTFELSNMLGTPKKAPPKVGARPARVRAPQLQPILPAQR
jgi:hypothetical protein